MEGDENLLAKGKELFALCDAENKGFIIRNDLTRLGDQIPLSTEQLAEVFEGLDDDGNGYLTLQEFLDGFAGYLAAVTGENKSTPKDESPKTNDDQFEILLDHLGARNLFRDEEMVRAVWNHLKHRDSTLVLEFENFLGKISTELKHNLNETDTLRSALERLQ